MHDASGQKCQHACYDKTTDKNTGEWTFVLFEMRAAAHEIDHTADQTEGRQHGKDMNETEPFRDRKARHQSGLDEYAADGDDYHQYHPEHTQAPMRQCSLGGCELNDTQ